MERLNEWLRAGAAASSTRSACRYIRRWPTPSSNFSVVPRQNTPKPEPPYWGGYVEITREDERRRRARRWIEYGEEVPDGRLATAILLPTTMPHEYPTSMLDLIKALVDP